MIRRVAAAGCLAATAALLLLPGRWYLLAWLPFLAGAWQVLRLDRRAAFALIVAGGVLLPLVAARQPPTSSDDMYRYVWDGRVQLAGVDPYRHPPSALELGPLRDDFLWPDTANWCVPTGCTRINRPGVPTIYPPVAEAAFAAVVALSPAGARERPMQLAMAAVAAGVALLLWYILGNLGHNPRRAVLWAWCPLVALEAGNNAHVDVVAAALAAAALWQLAAHPGTRRAVAGGVLFGLAVATKLTPALLGPALLRRRPVAVAGSAAAAIAVVYLPHVLAAGPAVLGYLPGYLHEEGYADGARFALLGAVLPPPLATPAAALTLAALALLSWHTADPDQPWTAAATMAGGALLVTTPSYPWYAMLLVVLVAYGAPAEWLTVAAGGYLAQFAPELGLTVHTGQLLGYTTGLAAVLAGLAVRRRAREPAGAAPLSP
ncbi:glycosyltransferase 87 family protein [Dactylosporangium sucinum]|uniref:DUF2029 domain-containing protein n=1 Tax=Dactylosporangium sucinum TaxID=1424081 RepID=A0A917TU46_9ACTN|nr:glycosyltransferase 87 family protein [Dactylosporangium sucinum]GGM37499.1 hypothetical protein GCM10007977_043670 [Dactylosporangium sucinum]